MLQFKFSQYENARDFLNKTGLSPDQAIEFLYRKLGKSTSEIESEKLKKSEG